MGVIRQPIGIGVYLGTYMLIYEDLGDGWLVARSVDNENPGKSHGKQKPYTFTGKGNDAWSGRVWKDQVQMLIELPQQEVIA